ncbi:MAG: hypothetical protein ACR2F2_04870 [Pyrinomonadaceae bacterium]
MNANIEQIKPETLAMLEKQASRFGLSIDDYLRSLLPKTEKELSLQKGEFEADIIAFAEDTENLPTYNGTYSREDIYFDHD